MKKSSAFRKVTGFLFVSAAGTFLHFLYDLTGKSTAAALVSAVNESIWEHIKLVFYPMLLYSVAERHLTEEQTPSFRCIKLTGILLAMVCIPVVYYTYTGMFGISADWFNVTIFFLAAGAAYYLEYRLENSGCTCRISSGMWFAVLLLIAAAFTAATFRPPRIPLFRDPLTGSFGIGSAR